MTDRWEARQRRRKRFLDNLPTEFPLSQILNTAVPDENTGIPCGVWRNENGSEVPIIHAGTIPECKEENEKC